MKYNLDKKFEPFISTLGLVMKDGNTYPSINYESQGLNLNLLFEDYKNKLEKSIDNKYTGSVSMDKLMGYIYKEGNKPLSEENEITRFMDLQFHVERVVEELIFKDFKDMFKDSFYPFFDFTEHGTIYSKTEFKKAYVNKVLHVLSEPGKADYGKQGLK